MTVKFGFTLKKIYNICMGLRDNIQNKQVITQTVMSDSTQLSQQEIAYILKLVRDTTFQGKDIEAVYGIVYKLQQQYEK
jgi:hypothetical protein